MNDEMKAFLEHLFKTYSGKIYKTALRRIGDEEAAYDIMLETFLTAAERIEVLYSRPNRPGWLYAAMNNKIKEACKKRYITDTKTGRRRQVKVELLSAAEEKGADLPDPDNPFKEIEDRELIEKCKSVLNEREEKYFEYKLEEDLSTKEIAGRLNISYTNATTLWGQIKKKVAAVLKNN